MTICQVAWCDRKTKAKGFCCACYNQTLMGNDPHKPRRRKVRDGATDLERLEFNGWTVTDTGCWVWDGRKDRKEYGVLATLTHRQVFAHRLAYQTWVGPIPEGMSILHSCDNPPCINPEHLRPGTTQDNMKDKTVRERGNTTKLTALRVQEIKQRPMSHSHASLGREFSVSSSTIAAIRKGRIWKHVE